MVDRMTASELVAELGLIPHPEGGFFLETWRSGCEPMTTMGQTGLSSDKDELVRFTEDAKDQERAARRPDGESSRNALTSIYWMPTKADPRLKLAVNLSDHIHYYLGGAPFQYYIFDPKTRDFSCPVLGPDIRKGQKLQIPVKGGTWKCGILLSSDPKGDNTLTEKLKRLFPRSNQRKQDPDFCLIGEAVAPGFDFHDFTWVTPEMVLSAKADGLVGGFQNFVHSEIEKLQDASETIADSSEFYSSEILREKRKSQRLVAMATTTTTH